MFNIFSIKGECTNMYLFSLLYQHFVIGICDKNYYVARVNLGTAENQNTCATQMETLRKSKR